jgi:hypothetical protein
MPEQRLEAKLLALKATILKSESLYKTSILNHKEFGKVKVIYMKIKLLKISYATLLKKFIQEKENKQQSNYNRTNLVVKEDMID